MGTRRSLLYLQLNGVPIPAYYAGEIGRQLNHQAITRHAHQTFLPRTMKTDVESCVNSNIGRRQSSKAAELHTVRANITPNANTVGWEVETGAFLAVCLSITRLAARYQGIGAYFCARIHRSSYGETPVYLLGLAPQQNLDGAAIPGRCTALSLKLQWRRGARMVEGQGSRKAHFGLDSVGVLTRQSSLPLYAVPLL